MSHLAVTSAEFVVVTCYFNPARFKSRYDNYHSFAEGLRSSGVKLLTIECTFDDDPFVLPLADTLRVQTNAWLWQKERLLNIALDALPGDCCTVAWLDCDVVFSDPRWWRETMALLDSYSVVQPFKRVTRLSRDNSSPDSSRLSYCALPPRDITRLAGAMHGHPGFGWAARRETIQAIKLYDACLSGSGDHLMAHAFSGDLNSPCVPPILRPGSDHWQHFYSWAQTVQKHVGGRIGAASGELQHLWHGEMTLRRYTQRNQELKKYELDPSRDLRLSASGCWEWSSDKPELHTWARDYFESRLEDGP